MRPTGLNAHPSPLPQPSLHPETATLSSTSLQLILPARALLLYLPLTTGLCQHHVSTSSGHCILGCRSLQAPWPLLKLSQSKPVSVCPGIPSGKLLSLLTSTLLGGGPEQSCVRPCSLGWYGLMPIKQSAQQIGTISLCDSRVFWT